MQKLSIISTLVAAFRLGWQHRWLVFVLAVITAIPTALITAVTFQLVPPPPPANTVPEMGYAPTNTLLLGLCALVLLTINIVLNNMTTASLLGVLKVNPSTAELWPTIKVSIRSYTWRLIIVSILLAILACVITIPFTVIIGLFGVDGAGHGSKEPVVHSHFIEFIVILMAIVYVIFVKYALASPVIVIENKPSLLALEKSWRMTRGFFWYVLGSYVFLGTGEYCIDALFQHFESSAGLSGIMAIRLLVDGLIQYYWILLAWCMYWEINAADTPPPFVSERPAETRPE